MLGYHQRPEENAAALCVIAGRTWLRTGDVGQLDADGYLRLTDRKKDLFKTSGGKYVAPQQLENLLKQESGLISLVAICGNERKYVTALVALEEAALRAWGQAHGHALGYAELVQHPDVVAQIQAHVEAVNRHLASFETIKKFRLLPAEPSVATGELTCSMKLRRRVVTDKYRHLVEEMYDP
jgi:long-chain acyl-CoA synthetase